MIRNNNFALDSSSIREDRLLSIENQIEDVQPILQFPAHIYEWAKSCKSIFSDLIVKYSVFESIKSSATLGVELSIENLDKEYQSFKNLASVLYDEEPIFFKDFQFSVAYPRDRYLKLQKVEHILNVVAEHKEQGLSVSLPEAIINRLNSARNEVLDALQKQEKAKKELKHVKAEYDERFKADTKKLQLIKAWYFSVKTEEKVLISSIGMVIPKTRGTGKRIESPNELNYSINSKEFTWQAVEKATSYELALKLSNSSKDFSTIYAGKKERFFHLLSNGKYLVKIRARNKKGFGDWSDEFEIEVG